MLGKVKTKATDLLLESKEWFASSEPRKTYVKDLRKVLTYNGRKCQYPKNYDKIVENGEVIFKDGNYLLKYGGYEYPLIHVLYDKEGKPIITHDGKSYFTIRLLVAPKDREGVSDYRGYHKPFDFGKINLITHLPVFEVDTKLLKLTNSDVLAKKGSVRNDKGEIDEKDRDKKGRNGQLLYTSDDGKFNISFWEIRDHNDNLELGKSLISVPIVFVAGLAKVIAKYLTYLPMELGKYFINKKNPIAKAIGCLLFAPAAVVKNLVNMAATLLKLPVCAFVANKEKYGDAYWTMWKHQFKECSKETKSDYKFVIDGKRVEKQEDNFKSNITATWKELDAMRPGIEEDLKEKSKGASEKALSRSQSFSASESVAKKLETPVSKEEIKILNKELPIQTSTNHTSKLQEKRTSQTNGVPQQSQR